MLSSNVDKIIKASGYEIGFIHKQMGMDNVSFYTKRKYGKFTIDELENLFKIIDIEKIGY